MSKASRTVRDDLPTAIAIGGLAYMVAVLLHEGLGHGSICALVTGQPVLVTTTELKCQAASRAVAAAGPLLNLAIGLALLPVLGMAANLGVPLRFFLWFLQGYNLFLAGGYFLFSGFAGVGDWAVVFDGDEPQWLIRAAEVVVGTLMYYYSARTSATYLVSNILGQCDTGRVMRVATIPYCAAALIAAVASVVSNGRLDLIFLSALPSSLGGGAAFPWLMSMAPALSATAIARPAVRLGRSHLWLGVAVVAVLVFVFVFGPGVTL